MWHGAMIMHEEMTHRIGIMLLENKKSQLANNTKRTCILTNLLSASNQNFLSASNLYLFARDFSFTFPFFTVLTFFVTKIRKAIDVVIFYYFKVVCGILSIHFLLVYMCHCLWATTVRSRTMIRKHIFFWTIKTLLIKNIFIEPWFFPVTVHTSLWFY